MVKRMNKCVIKIGLHFSLLLISATASAFVAGGKAPGMALTGIAFPQDAFAAVYNPAGSADVGTRFDVGCDGLQDHKYLTITNSDTASNNDNNENVLKRRVFFNADVAINKIFRTRLLGEWIGWSAGIAVYNRDFIKTKYHKVIALVGTSPPLIEYLHETVTAFAAIKVFPRHNLGISADLHLQRLEIKGFENFDNATFSTSPGNVTNRGYAKSSGFGFTLGWMWDFSPCLSCGLTYRPHVKMDKFSKYKGFLAQHGKIDIPEKIGGGFSYEFLPRAVVAADVEWLRWRRIKSLDNDFLNEAGTMNLLGASNGPGFGWHNQVIYRVGVDWGLNECLWFRAGYSYSKCLVRNTETFFNSFLIDLIESTLTFGVTWKFRASSELTFFFLHGLEHQVKGTLTSIPASFGNGQASIRENKDALGLSLAYIF